MPFTPPVVGPRGPLRVLLTGTYSSTNKGDAAMQISTATAIRERWPDAEITISAPFPNQDAPLYTGIARVVRCHRRRLIFATFQVLRAGLWRAIHTASGRSATWLMPDAELRACLSADVVVDLSGDMLTDDYGPHVAYSHYIPIVNTLVLGRPLVLCAQSIGPFRWTGAIARRLMTRASVITVRDELSRDHLTAIGLNGAAVPRTGDMAFLLPAAPQRRAREILTEASVPHEDGVPTMSVSLSRSVQRQYDRSRPSGASPFVPLMAGVLDRFSAESGCRVLFVPHVTGPFPDRDERRLAHAVAGSMSCRSHVLPGDYRPEEIKAVIATCDLHVGGRMHANIAALGSGVPVVALSYSHKTPGIMRLFGQSDCVIDGRALTAGELLALLRGVWSRRAAVRREILTALADVTRGARQNVDIIAGLVDRGSPAPATAAAP